MHYEHSNAYRVAVDIATMWSDLARTLRKGAAAVKFSAIPRPPRFHGFSS